MSPYLALAAALILGLILGASLHALWQTRTRVQPMRPLPELEPEWKALRRQLDELDARHPLPTTSPIVNANLAQWESADFDPLDEDFWGEYPPPPYPHPSEATSLSRTALAEILRHREARPT